MGTYRDWLVKGLEKACDDVWVSGALLRLVVVFEQEKERPLGKG